MPAPQLTIYINISTHDMAESYWGLVYASIYISKFGNFQLLHHICQFFSILIINSLRILCT